MLEVQVNGKWFRVTRKMMRVAVRSDLKWHHKDTWQYWVWRLAIIGN